jgi:hypothetical protein
MAGRSVGRAPGGVGLRMLSGLAGLWVAAVIGLVLAALLLVQTSSARASVCRWDAVDTWTCEAKGQPDAMDELVPDGSEEPATSWTTTRSPDESLPQALSIAIAFDEAILDPRFPPKELISIETPNTPVWRDHGPGAIVPVCLFYLERRVVVNPCP